MIVLARDDLHEHARLRRYWLTAGVVLGTGFTAAMTMAALLVIYLATGEGATGLVTSDVLAARVAGVVAWRTPKRSLTVLAGVATARLRRLVR